MAPTRSPNSSREPKSLVKRSTDLVRRLLLDPEYFWTLATLLFIGELALGLLIIWRIPYTKIDWPAYMQQVEGFLAGERDYAQLRGETGPLVYPALHLYIYTALHDLLPSTDRVRPAQYVFLSVYLSTFLLIAYIYRRANAPQILLIPLTLSKRAHSIYLLRLFNDPWAMALLYSSIALFLRGGKAGWRSGTVMFSLALGVKMNVLLFLPGLLVLFFQYRGMVETIESVMVITMIQLLLPAPFFLSSTHLAKAYLTSAFDFSRQFLYEWTVNWRFVSKDVFHSREAATSLMIGHLSILVAFAWFKWSPTPGGTLAVLRRGFQKPFDPPVQPTDLPPHHIPLVMFTSNLIGMTFARSLHYQFHSWYFHQIPLLLYFSTSERFKLIGVLLWILIEWVWSRSPATPTTSALLLACHWIMLAGLWFRHEAAPSDTIGARVRKRHEQM